MKKVFLLTVLFLFLLSLSMTSCGNANHEHTFGKWEQISESSCTKQGEAIRCCTVKNCDYAETKLIDLKNHDYEDSITSPTKEKDGYTTHTCKNCAYVLVDTYVPAIGSANLKYDHIVTNESVTCIITGIGDCKDTDIYIPSYIGKYPVVAIAEDAFERCTSIKRVVIPKGIVEIGRSAFSECTNLEAITFSNTVQKVDANAFYWCTKLKNVYISDLTAWCKIDFDSPDANPMRYAENLVLNGEPLTSLTIPDGVTELGSYAFTYCTNFSEIIIPYGVTHIGFGTFSNCSITSITIPDSVTIIDAVAFSDSGITSITIPDSVQKIEMGAFSGCINLTNVKLPSNLTDIEIDLFSECWNLTNIDIPQTVTRIGAGAFENCSRLVSITIPKSVKTIGAIAFSDCSRLESIVFENTDNWKSYLTSTNGNPIDVTDPAENAAYFTKAGLSTHWERD